jgi:Peptidase propeptide and YPEB domain
MRTILSLIGVGVFSTTVALAQTTPPPQPAPGSPPMTAAPLPGANSFTEAEARSRIERAGYTSVSDLKKDDQGIWRGTAMKNGKSVKVSLDYKGNISET